jgi:hypothetical protein
MKVGEARSASRALSVAILNHRSIAKRREMAANNRLLHFIWLYSLRVERDDEFGTMLQVAMTGRMPNRNGTLKD